MPCIKKLEVIAACFVVLLKIICAELRKKIFASLNFMALKYIVTFDEYVTGYAGILVIYC